MSTTNCVNCGAIKQMDEMKCPYCGTLYFDLTALDLDHNMPVACVFRMPSYFSNMDKVTMLARPYLESIEQDIPDEATLYSDNRVVARIISPSIPRFNLQFHPVPQHNGQFITVYTKDRIK